MTVLTLKLDAIFFQGIVYRKQIKAEEFMIVTLIKHFHCYYYSHVDI